MWIKTQKIYLTLVESDKVECLIAEGKYTGNLEELPNNIDLGLFFYQFIPRYDPDIFIFGGDNDYFIVNG